MTTRRVRAPRWVVLAVFCSGVTLIAATPILNLVTDRTDGNGLAAALPLLGGLYGSLGKLGVTVVFTAAGVGLIVLGLALPSSRQGSSRGVRTDIRTTTVVLFNPPTETDVARAVLPWKSMELRTRRYLPPERSLHEKIGLSPRRKGS
jgi:hypothetical protein